MLNLLPFLLKGEVMLTASEIVMCGHCGSERDYALLADSMYVTPCKNGCHGGVVISQKVMEGAISGITDVKNKRNEEAEAGALV